MDPSRHPDGRAIVIVATERKAYALRMKNPHEVAATRRNREHLRRIKENRRIADAKLADATPSVTASPKPAKAVGSKELSWAVSLLWR